MTGADSPGLSSGSRLFQSPRARAKSVSAAKAATPNDQDDFVIPARPPQAHHTQSGPNKLRSKRHSRNASLQFDSESLAQLSLSPPSRPDPMPLSARSSEPQSTAPSVTGSRLRKVPSRLAFWNKDNAHLEDASTSSGSSTSTTASKRSRSVAKRSSPNKATEIAAAASIQSANDLFPRRVTGWFAQMMHANPSTSPSKSFASNTSSSATSSSGPSTFSQKLSSPLRSFSPARQSPSPNKQAQSSARRGMSGLDRMLDRASNYFFDTDASVDRNEEDIWVLGVRHDGWRPDNQSNGANSEETDLFGPLRQSSASRNSYNDLQDSEASYPGKRKASNASSDQLSVASPESLEPSARSRSEISLTSNSSTPITQQYTLPNSAQSHGWPASFYLDFTSRIQLVYRANFPALPLPDSPPSSTGSNPFQSMVTLAASIGRNPAAQTRTGLTTDAGWGCMLRTGQSLLANALAAIHLGRDWRRPLEGHASHYAAYARLLSWFIDDPSDLAPFSVHRFAAIGKELGKEIGQWFGPSTAAGAMKTLCQEFSPAQLGVSNAIDGTVYTADVLAASQNWSRPVLILLNIRLGIAGVNAIYHPSLKSIFTLPQSIGIAGGRPSSSYYFVGAQGDNLFYIDPHHTAESVPLQSPPLELRYAALNDPLKVQEEDWQVADSSGSSPTLNMTPQSELDTFYTQAYPPAALSSFHPDRVRKIAVSSIDPSMLVGFVVRHEADFEDWKTRVQALKPTLCAIADKAPTWARQSSSFSRRSEPPSPHGIDTAESASDGETDADWDITDSEEGSADHKDAKTSSRAADSIEEQDDF